MRMSDFDTVGGESAEVAVASVALPLPPSMRALEARLSSALPSGGGSLPSSDRTSAEADGRHSLPQVCREVLDSTVLLGCSTGLHSSLSAAARGAFSRWNNEALKQARLFCHSSQDVVSDAHVEERSSSMARQCVDVYRCYVGFSSPLWNLARKGDGPLPGSSLLNEFGTDGAAPWLLWLAFEGKRQPELIRLVLLLSQGLRPTRGSSASPPPLARTVLDAIASSCSELPSLPSLVAAELERLAQERSASCSPQNERDACEAQRRFPCGSSVEIHDAVRGAFIACAAAQQSQRQQLLWARCAMMALTALPNAAAESLLRTNTCASWFRSALAVDRYLSDCLRSAPHLVEFAAEATHFLMFCTESRIHSSLGVARYQPGNTPLHTVAQAAADDERFSNSDGRTFEENLPFSLALQTLTLAANTEGRTKLSLLSVLLDAQKSRPLLGLGTALLTIHEAGVARTAVRSYLAPSRGPTPAVQQHTMEEGFVEAATLTLLSLLERGRRVLSEAPLGDAADSEQARGQGGYPRLPSSVCSALYDIQGGAIAAIEMLRAVVAVSQHYTTNPVAFLLTPMGQPHAELGRTLLDWVAAFGEYTPELTTSALCLLAGCVHHNVRDVVPALLERGIVPTTVACLQARIGVMHKYPPVVRLATAPLLQALSIHQQSRADVTAHCDALVEILHGLVECATYPMRRLATPRASCSDWPAKMPTDYVVQCGKDFFSLVRELPQEDSHRVVGEVGAVLALLEYKIASAPSWGLRDALEQLMDFLSAITPFGSGGRGDRGDGTPFGFRRMGGSRDDDSRGSNAAAEMHILHKHNIGRIVQGVVKALLDSLGSRAVMASDSNDAPDLGSLFNTSGQTESAPGDSTGVVPPSRSVPSGSVGSPNSGMLTLDLLAPLLARMTLPDFGLAVTPITNAANAVLASARASLDITDGDADVLQNILAFVMQLPDPRRTDHISSLRERLWAVLNDVYCIALERQRQLQAATEGAVMGGPQAAASAPIFVFLSAMQKVFHSHSAAAANSARGLLRGLPGTPFVELPTINALTRVNQEIATYLSSSRSAFDTLDNAEQDESCQPSSTAALAAAAPTSSSQEQAVAELEQVMSSAVVRLQSATAILTSPAHSSSRHHAPGGLPPLLNMRTADVLRLVQHFGCIAKRHIVVAAPLLPDETSNDASNTSQEAAGHTATLRRQLTDALESVLLMVKLSTCGNRLIARDAERRKHVCFIVFLFYSVFAPRRLYTQNVLSCVMQLLASISRETIFSVQPPPHSNPLLSSSPRVSDHPTRAFLPDRRPPQRFPVPSDDALRRRFDSPTADDTHSTDAFRHSSVPGLDESFAFFENRFHTGWSAHTHASRRATAQLSPQSADADATTMSDVDFDALRRNILLHVADTIGPMWDSVTTEVTPMASQNRSHGPSSIDVDIKHAAAQVMYTAFGAPHYREVVARTVGERIGAGPRSVRAYAAFLHSFGVCIAQKGNLPLRKAIAACSPVVAHIESALRSVVEDLEHASAVLAADCEEVDPAAVVRSKCRHLRDAEYLLGFLAVLSFPPSASPFRGGLNMYSERLCDHYQNGFCWNGGDCRSAHADSLVHLRFGLDASDRRVADAIANALYQAAGQRDGAPAIKVESTIDLLPPSFVPTGGCSLLTHNSAASMLPLLVELLRMLASEERAHSALKRNSTMSTGGVALPLLQAAETCFRNVVKVMAQLLVPDDGASRGVLHAAPLQDFAAFDSGAELGHRELVAQLVRYTVEDRVVSDALVYRSLVKVAEGLLEEDVRRDTMVVELSEPMIQQLAEAAVDNDASGKIIGPLQKYLFALSELLRDSAAVGARFPIAASRVLRYFCVPATIADGGAASEDTLGGRPKGHHLQSRNAVWISPGPPDAVDLAKHTRSANCRQSRSDTKQTLRSLLSLLSVEPGGGAAACPAVSIELVATILAEIAALPHVQSAAFSRRFSSDQPAVVEARQSDVDTAAARSSSLLVHRSIFLDVLMTVEHQKTLQFLSTVAARNAKVAVSEWLHAVTAAPRMAGGARVVDALLMRFEGLLRQHGRDRLIEELSRPHNVEHFAEKLIDSVEAVTSTRAGNAALLFICSQLKRVPSSAAKPAANTGESTVAEGSAPSALLCPPTPHGGAADHHESGIDMDSLVAMQLADRHHTDDEVHDVLVDAESSEDSSESQEDAASDENDDEAATNAFVAAVPGAAAPEESRQRSEAVAAADAGSESSGTEEEEEDDEADDGDVLDESLRFGQLASAGGGLLWDDDDDSGADARGGNEVRIIGHNGEELEVRFLQGGRRSFIMRGEGMSEHDPDFIRELLYRAQMDLRGGGAGELSVAMRDGMSAVQRHRLMSSRQTLRSFPNPEEVSSVMWQHAVSSQRVVALARPPDPCADVDAPRSESEDAVRVDASHPWSSAMLQALDGGSPDPSSEFAQPALVGVDEADELIMRLFGAASTRTPSTNRIVPEAIASSVTPDVVVSGEEATGRTPTAQPAVSVTSTEHLAVVERQNAEATPVSSTTRAEQLPSWPAPAPLPTLEEEPTLPTSVLSVSTGPLPWEGTLEPQFLIELPADIRADIVREHYPLFSLTAPHTCATGQPTHFHPLFLAALPSELQAEVLAIEESMQSTAVPAASNTVTQAALPVPTPDPSPGAATSEALLLLALVTEDDLRRDILLSCELSELVGNPSIHAQAVALREQQRAERDAQRQRQQAESSRRREDEARRALDEQRRRDEARLAAARNTTQHFHQRLFRSGSDEDLHGVIRRQRETSRRQRSHHPSSPEPHNRDELRTSPLHAAALVKLVRFVTTATAQTLGRILASAAEGLAVADAADVIHSLLDYATQPMTEAVVNSQNALAEASDTPQGVRPTKLVVGGMPPSTLVVRVLATLVQFVTKCRAASYAMVCLPSAERSLMTGGKADIYSPMTPEDVQYAARLPILRVINVMIDNASVDVHMAAEKVLDVVLLVARDLSASGSQAAANGDLNRAPFLPGPGVPLVHSRHPHPLAWSNILSDPRYNRRPYQCNVCRSTNHVWGYHCGSCQFDLCAACALDDVSADVQTLRLSRWSYWSIAATELLPRCVSLLQLSHCREETAVRCVRLLCKGIRLCSDDLAPFTDKLDELELVLRSGAKFLTGTIADALKRLRKAQETQDVALAGVPSSRHLTAVATLSAAKQLALLELPDETMRHVYLLFMPYAETRRQLPVEVRSMWHASRVYLSEVSNILAHHPNRSRAALPAAVFPLVNGYAQFHLLQDRSDTESMSVAERTETERLLSEKLTEVSHVSDAAVAAAAAVKTAAASAPSRGQQPPARAGSPVSANTPVEPLPHGVYKFCEANRALINTLIHWDPSLLESGFKFITRAPRLIDLDFKLKSFRKNLQRLRGRVTAGQTLTVARSTVFQDSFKALRDAVEPGQVHIRFQGEEGSDAGGLTREWFQILGEEMVNDNYALFVHSSEGMTYQPNPCSGINVNHLEYFRFCGYVVGLAIFNEVPLDIHFTRSVYRHMIGVDPCFRDVESIDPVMFANLEKLLNMNITEELSLDFTVNFERFGKTEEVELVPDGANVPVTNENKKEYIKLRSAFLMTRQIEEQLRQFLAGLYCVIPRTEIQMFTEHELELVISGMPDIDVEDLRLNTEYGGFHQNSPIIRWFWEIVASMTRQDRANLLQFATGSSKVPHGGFANLESGGNRHRFSITKVDMPLELLPQAHTCFNRIDLPEYTSCEMLREKLMLAITYGNKGFAMV